LLIHADVSTKQGVTAFFDECGLMIDEVQYLMISYSALERGSCSSQLDFSSIMQGSQQDGKIYHGW
jgi:hypothetical protein